MRLVAARVLPLRVSSSVLAATLAIFATAACQPTAPEGAVVAQSAVTSAQATALARPQVTIVEQSPLSEVTAQAILPAYLTAFEKVDQAKNDASDDFRNANP